MRAVRAPLAEGFARQILQTMQPFLSVESKKLTVLDVGCGYGFTTRELAKQCKHVIGIEPNEALFTHARQLQHEAGCANLEFWNVSIADLDDRNRFDLVVLDNVLEHIADQRLALCRIAECLKPGGATLIIVPNKLWPIEVHYGLPFLSYLPRRAANWYLRLTGRGTDYSDASHAPTYWGIRRLFAAQPELSYQFVLPADISLATLGRSLHYRAGAAALRWCSWLWCISKVFVIVGVKR